jgi:hypothetical protein
MTTDTAPPCDETELPLGVSTFTDPVTGAEMVSFTAPLSKVERIVGIDRQPSPPLAWYRLLRYAAAERPPIRVTLALLALRRVLTRPTPPIAEHLLVVDSDPLPLDHGDEPEPLDELLELATVARPHGPPPRPDTHPRGSCAV